MLFNKDVIIKNVIIIIIRLETKSLFLAPNPPYRKIWWLYILPQFVSNLTQLIIHEVNFSVRFYEQFYGFHALRTVGKCTGRHLFRYGGLCIKI